MNLKPNSKQAIAQECGVDPATVSLALNNHPRVAEKTRLRIQAAARRLGYVPNQAARQLALGRHGRHGRSVERVGLVLFDGGLPVRGVYMAFLAGVEQRVSALGGLLVFVRETETSLRGRFAGFARSEIVDGLALVGAVDDKALRKAKQAKRPLVVIGDHHCSTPVHQATVDFRAMGRLAVQHLLALGHRRIGFIADRTVHIYQREILAGSQAAMEESGLALQVETWTPDGDPQTLDPVSKSPMDAFIAGRVTAIVVGEPGSARHSLNALASRGMKSPDDISLVACELSDAKPPVPGMACVDASMEEVGSAAVDLLREVAANPGGQVRQVLVPPRLTEGWSARALERPEDAG